ncbi:MAG TPA: YdeI/OmpD-associated family protein [Actinoplanes sp.]|nr:YdeI/OmpD-associated family protein [Actinoplanes sp.]
MTEQRFSGELQAARGGGALVVLPPEVLAGLGGGSRFRVTGRLNGVEFESSTMAMGGGQVCLGVHKATRQAAGVEFGDTVDVRLRRDERPRRLDVPEDLVAALAADPAAAAAFERLSFSHRREYVEWITGAKRPDTRTRRVAQTLDRLRA